MGGSSGCLRGVLVAGGCILVLLVCVVGVTVFSGVLWDRGSEPTSRWLIGRIVDRAGSDVSDQVESALPAIDSLETRRIESRSEYLDTLADYNVQFGRAMEQIARLLTNPRLQDEEWSNDVAAQIAEIRRIEAEARAIEPPEDMASIHQHWVDSLHEVSNSMESLASGLDNLSLTQVFASIEALERATRSFESMMREIDEIESQ
jgi:hypothetical protein